MTPLDIRPYESRDEKSWALLEARFLGEAVSLSAARQAESQRPAGLWRERRVALRGQKVVGIAQVAEEPMGEMNGRVSLLLYVLRPARRSGVGVALLGALQAPVRESRCLQLEAIVRDNRATALRWAERRGWSRVAHRLEAILDLEGFRPECYARHVNPAIKLEPIASALLRVGPSLWEDLHARMAEASSHAPDEPGVTFMPGDLRSWGRASPWLDPTTSVLAWAEGEMVGFTLNYAFDDDERYTGLTGSLPQWQGQGLATALKAEAARLSARNGARYLRTNVDARNTAMRVVNDRMGFESVPGWWRLHQSAAEFSREETPPVTL